jgi:lysophospholipase L1-like esterase
MFTSPLPYLLLIFPFLANTVVAQEAPRRVLFLGNSITLHAPAPNIGWEGNWGMAASAIEKDYVHILLQKWNSKNGNTPDSMIKNIAEFERNLGDYDIEQQLKSELSFKADVVILAIGENAASPKTDEERIKFSAALELLLKTLKSNGGPTIYVRSQFWPDTEKDSLLKKAAEKGECVWVDLKQLGADPINAASAERHFEHAGVAGHPGDKGMQAIADRIWDAIQQHAKRE